MVFLNRLQYFIAIVATDSEFEHIHEMINTYRYTPSKFVLHEHLTPILRLFPNICYVDGRTDILILRDRTPRVL